MTKHEFENLTGKKVSDMEYTYIENMYMECGEMDKQTFCKYYPGLVNNPIFEYYLNGYRDNREHLNAQGLECEIVAFDLIRKSVQLDDDELSLSAIALIGKKRYILYKLENELPLSSWDRERLKGML